MLYRIFIIGNLLLMVFGATSQNLVPNWSFEDISLCPDNQGQILMANFWSTANSNTPDLYNSCNVGSYGVPTNFFGYKEAKTGNGYAGIYTYLQVDQREYLQVSLKDSLIANSKYYVSLYVALTKSSKYAIDSLGIYFSNDSVISASLEYLSLSPQVSSGSNFVTDTSWQKISDTLIANGGEKYLIIGNFSSDNQTSVIDVGGSLGGGYYFIDDVSVTLIDSIVGIAEKRNENTTIIYPNPTKGAITMSLSKAPHEASALIIYNVLGEQVENIPIRGINTQLILQQPAGVYFYHFKIKQEVVSSGKLIISH